ncbi:MAG TPA: diacylglycerol kinase family protein [Terriglobales bacterium]|jgi:YegS/Rv2252/BmrU family lipid kinase|nr:diacylglycerol kinase family protein [Terriglobales bacterium]
MRKAALLYNPASGHRRERRLAHVEEAAAVLRAAGVEVLVMPTRAAGTAGEQAREAVAAGCDTILACGGDGTVHEILPGLAGGAAALGVIPLGTGNGLANDLGTAHHTAQAARQLLLAETRRIALGHVEFHDREGRPGQRYFTVAAGAGGDARMLYEVGHQAKGRHGMLAYYLNVARQLVTYPLSPFEVEYRESGSGERRVVEVSQMLAIRIRDFGGIVRKIAPQAGLERDDFQLLLVRTARRRAFLRYIVQTFLDRPRRVRDIDIVYASEATCRELAPDDPRRAAWPRRPPCAIYTEADGEVLGRLPLRLSMAPAALNLLFPARPKR